MTEYKRGQWAAFNRVLHWINEQENNTILKTNLYEAVMDMRPNRETDMTDWDNPIVKENSQLKAYIKAFLWATIDPDENPKTMMEHFTTNPSIEFIFMLKPHGIVKERTITCGQIWRAIELIGADKLKIAPAPRTIDEDIDYHRGEARKANERIAELERENEALKSQLSGKQVIITSLETALNSGR